MESKRIKCDWEYGWITYEWRTEDGKRHRLDGPAVEHNDGSKWWYVDGKRHRLDGPAIEYNDGDKLWCVNGILLTEEQFNKHPLVIKHRNKKMIKEWLLND